MSRAGRLLTCSGSCSLGNIVRQRQGVGTQQNSVEGGQTQPRNRENKKQCAEETEGWHPTHRRAPEDKSKIRYLTIAAGKWDGWQTAETMFEVTAEIPFNSRERARNGIAPIQMLRTKDNKSNDRILLYKSAIIEARQR